MNLNQYTKAVLIERIGLFYEMLEKRKDLQESFETIMTGGTAYVDAPFNGFINYELPKNAIGVRWNGPDETVEFKFKDLGPVYWVRPSVGTFNESDVG
jgi:hypothetical protein